MAKVQFHLGNF